MATRKRRDGQPTGADDTGTDPGAGAEPKFGDNAAARHEYVTEKMQRLEEIKAERKVLAEEATEIVDGLEKDAGVHRGALADVRKTMGLPPAAQKLKIKSRDELEAMFILPGIEQAEAAGSEG